MELRYPSLRLEVGEHVVLGVIVDLSAPAILATLNRLGYTASDIVKLVAVKLNPVVPLSPMVGTEELGYMISGVSIFRGVVFEDTVVVKGFKNLNEALLVGRAF